MPKYKHFQYRCMFQGYGINLQQCVQFEEKLKPTMHEKQSGIFEH